MSDENGSAPNCNGPRKLQLIRSAVIALAIISFIYFEIHSCSMDDDIASPEQPSFVSDNVICAASDVFFRDSEFGCVLGTLGTLMTTLDGGRTWKGSTLGDGNLNDVHFQDRARGWVAGKDGSLYSTLDGGETWMRNEGQGYEADEDFFEVQFFSENVGYLLGYGGDHDGAADCYRRALSIGPATAELHFNFGIVLGKQGAFEQAARPGGEAGPASSPLQGHSRSQGGHGAEVRRLKGDLYLRLAGPQNVLCAPFRNSSPCSHPHSTLRHRLAATDLVPPARHPERLTALRGHRLNRALPPY